MPKKKPKEGKPKVHKDLKGFAIDITQFGEMTSNVSVEDLNKFLNKQVDDKKLRDRDDLHEEWEKERQEEMEAKKDLVPDEMDEVDESEIVEGDEEDE